jgi:hypothetical protein
VVDQDYLTFFFFFGGGGSNLTRALCVVYVMVQDLRYFEQHVRGKQLCYII